MRLTLRFVVPLILMFGLIAYGILPLVDSLTYKWFTRDMDIRTKLIANSMQDSLAESLERPDRVQQLFNRVIQDERLLAIGFCDNQNTLVHKSGTFPDGISCGKATELRSDSNKIIKLSQGPFHLAFYLIEDSHKKIGQLALVHDLSFVERRSAFIKSCIIYFFIALLILISLITVLIAQLSFRSWVKGIRAIIRNDHLESKKNMISEDLRPMFKNLMCTDGLAECFWMHPEFASRCLHDKNDRRIAA